MGLLDIISDIIRNKQISKANINRRGIVEYNPSQIGGFIESDIFNNNVVVSGGTDVLRSEVIVNLCIAATNASIPVIILHQGDTELQRLFRTIYQQHPAYIEVGSRGKYFDPFYQIPVDQISGIIIKTAPKTYNLSGDGAAYLNALTGYLDAKKHLITLKGLSSAPPAKISNLLSNAASKNTLTPATVQELQAYLAQGQSEAWRVKTYLSSLYDECVQLLPPDKRSYTDCVSIIHSILNRSVLNLDIISDNNILLLRLISEQLQMLIRRGHKFYLILDNLSIRQDNAIKTLCGLNSANAHCAVVGKDVFSLCEGNDGLFGMILGSVNKIFLFQHGPGPGAEKWSSAFSKYIKIDTTVNYGRGSGSGGGLGFPLQGGFLSGGINWSNMKNSYNGFGYQDKDEMVIRAEEIIKLSERGGYVYTTSSGELAYINTFLPM